MDYFLGESDQVPRKLVSSLSNLIVPIFFSQWRDSRDIKKEGNHKSFFVWEERWLEKDFSQLNGARTHKVTVYPFI